MPRRLLRDSSLERPRVFVALPDAEERNVFCCVVHALLLCAMVVAANDKINNVIAKFFIVNEIAVL